MADFGNLNNAVVQLQTDAEALIALQGTEDPTIQQNINAATDSVNAIDAAIKMKLGG